MKEDAIHYDLLIQKCLLTNHESTPSTYNHGSLLHITTSIFYITLKLNFARVSMNAISMDKWIAHTTYEADVNQTSLRAWQRIRFA